MRKELSFYLLGGSESLNAETARVLQRISGRRDGFFDEQEEEKVVGDINRSGAGIVWVGLGKPKEKLFCARNRDPAAQRVAGDMRRMLQLLNGRV